MKHETFTSSGNAKSELEDYSRKIAAKPSLVGTIHRNDGGLVGNFAMLNQHDVVAGNAHFLSWAEQRREEREREVPNDFNTPTLPRSYIWIYSSSSSSLQSWALLLRRRVVDRSMGLARNGLYSILMYCTVFLWLWHSDEIINILGFLPFFQNRGSQTQKKKSLSAWWSPPDS